MNLTALLKKILLLVLIATVILPAKAQTIPVYVPTDGLLAWYPFTGNAIDSSGRGFDGTVHGATLTTDRFGNTNSAYQFDGSSTYISTSLLPPTGNGARTLACWFKYDSTPDPCGDRGLCLLGYGGNNRGCGFSDKNFSMEVNYYYGPPVARVDGICIATDQTVDSLDSTWHFFAAVYDSAFGDFRNIKLYVDGVYKTTTTYVYGHLTDVITDSLTRVDIGMGHYPDCRRYFDGAIDDIGVWNRALTNGELYGMYHGSPTAAGDSFLVYQDNRCSYQNFTVLPKHYSSGLSVRTLFGDGTSRTDTFVASTGMAQFSHVYAASSIYTVKHILYNGLTAVDSISYTYHHIMCSNLPLRIFHDANGNCLFDATETVVFQPSLVSIDSNGVTIDTISITSGLDYYAYAPVGTAYTFKIVNTVPGLVVNCPVSGAIQDTVTSGPASPKYIGMTCSTHPGYDLKLFPSFRAGSHHFGGVIMAVNTLCSPPAATITMQMNPQYPSDLSFIPAPYSIVGNSVKWYVNSLSSVSSSPYLIYANMEGSSAMGDTVLTTYNIDPTIGDANPSDNFVIVVDTAQGGYDPNDISVTPSCLKPGEHKLQYTIRFENTGTDTAFNIYILDTLSPNLDVRSLRLIAASAAMNTSVLNVEGNTIVKFEFPHINLLDSSHHGYCDGMVVYTINTKSDVHTGAAIEARAGIYFDYNPVVITNTAVSTIGCPVLSVTQRSIGNDIDVIPNPAGDHFTLVANSTIYQTAVLKNSMGQQVLSINLNNDKTNVNTTNLPAGIYYLTVSGAEGSVVKKLVKM